MPPHPGIKAPHAEAERRHHRHRVCGGKSRKKRKSGRRKKYRCSKKGPAGMPLCPDFLFSLLPAGQLPHQEKSTRHRQDRAEQNRHPGRQRVSCHQPERQEEQQLRHNPEVDIIMSLIECHIHRIGIPALRRGGSASGRVIRVVQCQERVRNRLRQPQLPLCHGDGERFILFLLCSPFPPVPVRPRGKDAERHQC